MTIMTIRLKRLVARSLPGGWERDHVTAEHEQTSKTPEQEEEQKQLLKELEFLLR